jgi:hypothetical protein
MTRMTHRPSWARWELTHAAQHITSAMVGPLRFGVSTPKLQPCFARPGPQTAFGLSRAIHRAPHFVRWRSLVAVLLFIAHCGRSFRGLTPHSIHVLVQPAKPKDRFTMAQRYVQYGGGATLAFARCAILNRQPSRLAGKGDSRKPSNFKNLGSLRV